MARKRAFCRTATAVHLPAAAARDALHRRHHRRVARRSVPLLGQGAGVALVEHDAAWVRVEVHARLLEAVRAHEPLDCEIRRDEVLHRHAVTRRGGEDRPGGARIVACWATLHEELPALGVFDA